MRSTYTAAKSMAMQKIKTSDDKAPVLVYRGFGGDYHTESINSSATICYIELCAIVYYDSDKINVSTDRTQISLFVKDSTLKFVYGAF